jgi:cell division protein FtsQ
MAAAALGGLGVGAAAGPALVARLDGGGFRIARVAVSGQARLAPAEVAAAAALHPGAPLTPEALARARERLRAHPWIASARVVALPPSRALVRVEERRPVARAALADGLAWVDATGMPFATAEASDPGPLLVGVPDAERGRAHPVLAQGVALLAALEAQGLPAAAEVVLGGAPPEALPALRISAAGPRVILGAGDPNAKLARLARLRAAGLAEVANATEIDLRFGDDVVLRGGPAPGGSGETGTRGGADPS